MFRILRYSSQLFLLCFLTPGWLLAQSRWSYQLGEELTQYPYGVMPLSQDTILAFTLGNVLRTTDGGASWTVKRIGLEEGFITTGSFLDKQTGWAVADGGYVLKTADAGDTWTILDTLERFYRPNTVHFWDESHGILAGLKSSYDSAAVMQTQDGGQSWQEVWNLPVSSFSTNPDIVFPDDTTGYMTVSEEGLWKTLDAGATWTPVMLPAEANLAKVSFVSADTGYVSGAGNLLLHTVDGGASWTPLVSGFAEDAIITGLHFLDADRGWIVSQTGQVHATTDGGDTWTPQVMPGSGYVYVSDLVFTPDGAVGAYPAYPYELMVTTDGGATWNNILQGVRADLYDIARAEEDTLYAVGEEGTLLRSVDGENWLPQTSGVEVNLRGVAFGGGTGWAVGDSATVLTLSQAGSWQTQATPLATMVHLHDIAAMDAMHAWAVGTAGTILHYDGTTWTEQTTPVTTTLHAVTFADAMSGWAVGDSGVVLSTTDGGQVWNLMPTGVLASLYGVHFPTPEVGYAVGARDYILKTQDGGQTWYRQTIPAMYVTTFRGVAFTSPHRGWIVGNSGNMLYTTDGGHHWQAEPKVISLTLRGALFDDLNRGWAVGNTGSVFSFSDQADGSNDTTPERPALSYEPTADTLRNYTEDLTLEAAPALEDRWGYLTGMSGYYDEEFAEKYYVSGPALVTHVVSHHQGVVAHPTHVAEFNVFSIDTAGYPDLKIGRQDVAFGDLDLSGAAMTTPFFEPVAVEDSFFVAFNVTDYAHGGFDGDTLAVMHTADGTRSEEDLSTVARNAMRVHSHSTRAWEDIHEATEGFQGHLALFPVVQFASPTASDPFVRHRSLTLYAPYPNPARDQLTVAFETQRPGDFTVTVVDVLGRVVHEEATTTLTAGKHRWSLPAHRWQAGWYVVRVSGVGSTLAAKVLMQ
ncbi:Por secretion system C-terminal sorting domain-containing protein [Catalinimonas alkaloidigena]|uniref:Por secretion system C-terminal sorting domain-containing protein n=1 Tax=Catalinimonas alkaloidigena TaxID=1075417 RepID=A0A1G9VEG6_9BACT|nr:YCF48-related protein [Catalinimonas alkaloidigena]SDM70506.1 Por secretion system C-terminal sorting domain-containing protein [Catalinimonas alkaloidigena]